jgi:hypothetical protein
MRFNGTSKYLKLTSISLIKNRNYLNEAPYSVIMEGEEEPVLKHRKNAPKKKEKVEYFPQSHESISHTEIFRNYPNEPLWFMVYVAMPKGSDAPEYLSEEADVLQFVGNLFADKTTPLDFFPDKDYEKYDFFLVRSVSSKWKSIQQFKGWVEKIVDGKVSAVILSVTEGVTFEEE